MFTAIQLVPSESLYAPNPPNTEEIAQRGAAPFLRLVQGLFEVSPSKSSPPLRTWGISLGILTDLLEMLSPHTMLQLWQFPTFTAPDLRLLIYLFTFSLRKQNARLLNSGTWSRQKPDAESRTAAVPVPEAEPNFMKSGNAHGDEDVAVPPPIHPALTTMVSGYYDRVNIAIAAFLVLRLAAVGASSSYIFSAWRRRHLSR
jgi:hypothetical protein